MLQAEAIVIRNPKRLLYAVPNLVTDERGPKKKQTRKRFRWLTQPLKLPTNRKKKKRFTDNDHNIHSYFITFFRKTAFSGVTGEPHDVTQSNSALGWQNESRMATSAWLSSWVENAFSNKTNGRKSLYECSNTSERLRRMAHWWTPCCLLWFAERELTSYVLFVTNFCGNRSG